MIRDTWTVAWKEWKELATWDGGWVALTSFLALAGLVGVVLPWQVGPAWVRSPWAMLFWAWLPLFLVTTVIADSFAGERERRTLETLLATRLPDGAILAGKVAAAVGWVWAATLLCLPLGLLTVNVVHVEGGLLLYSPQAAAGIAVLALLAALLGAGIGALVSLGATSVRHAQQTLTIAVLVLFFLPVLALRILPDAWVEPLVWILVEGSTGSLALWAATVLGLLDLGVLAIAARRFRRDRLIA